MDKSTNKRNIPQGKGLLKSYLNERMRIIVMSSLFVSIFAMVFKLYHLPVKIAIYPALICFVLWLLYSSLDFYLYIKAHAQRVSLVNNIEVTLDNLPQPCSLLETDYQSLLKVLADYNTEQTSEKNRKLSDMEEYITLWSHQMKTPITAIGLLLQEVDEPIQSKLVGQVFEMERYVDTILQYMRLDTMNSDLLLKEYALMPIVKQAIKYYSKTFISKRISLNLKEFDTMVVSDEKWLLFVVKQIISNALKYTEKGHINIYVIPEKTLIIEDSGIGIPTEDIPRIFERGFTGYNGRMEKKSTGIGLYLSKQILNQLGHKIDFFSQLGLGTRVEINLINLTK